MADLTYRGTDIRDANIRFDVVRGYAELPSVRGEDTVIPGKAGRTVRARKKDRRVIELQGHIKAVDAATWRTKTDVAMALFDPSLTPGALVITTPYLGLGAGTKTIQCRVLSVIGGRIIASRYQPWTIELEAVGDPPDWS